LPAFRDSPVDGWTLAAWFTTRSATLEGATPAQWLADDGDTGLVRALSEDAARRWVG
jgi:hypothetical protein